MKKRNRRKKHSFIGLLCWIIVPFAMIALLVLDGMGIYTFNTDRLLVVGVCVLVSFIPFFEEISIKNISFKKERE